jgi:TolB-like protein
MRTVKILVIVFSSLFLSFSLKAQTEAKKSVAVISIDTRGLELDNLGMGNLVRLELEKTNKFEVMDKYDVDNQVTKMNTDPAAAFGKTTLVDIGKNLTVDYILTGSTQVFGDKIIYILRLIDVKQDKITETSVKEYVNNELHIQLMTRISVMDLLDLPYDENVAAKLENVPTPIVNENTRLNLSGPRFGLQFFTGRLAERMADPRSEGGFNSQSFASVFGYQQEIQYLNSGKFQALVEFIGTVNGIENGYFSPSLVLLHGVRYDGWEFGLGPALRLTKTAKGYYLDGNWIKTNEAPNEDISLINNIDSRGNAALSTGLVIALGKTFSSGHLNLPVNVYYSYEPNLNSAVYGFLLGFNIARQ